MTPSWKRWASPNKLICVVLQGLELLRSLEYLEGQKFASFETSCALLKELGSPQDSYPTIHIAGTNGKGSVSAMINGMLMSAGYKVGVTTSPHLGRVAERCLINGRPISDELFSAAIVHVCETADRLKIPYTYFVAAVSAAFEAFRREKVEFGVIECGLGGTLDVTNAIASPVATVITSVDFDHTEILGSTIEAIAANKAGIAKPGVPLFVGPVSREAEAVIRNRAAEVGAPCFVVGTELQPTEVKLPLHGSYQRYNATLAIAVAKSIGVDPSDITTGLERTSWPGRLETIEAVGSGNATVLLDVAHNPSGVRGLVEYLAEFVPHRFNSVSFLVSILGRKDWHGMLTDLARAKTLLSELGVRDVQWGFTRSVNPASLPPELLCSEFGEGRSFASATEGLTALCKQPGLVVVTGSSFIVGECRMELVSDPFSIYQL